MARLSVRMNITGRNIAVLLSALLLLSIGAKVVAEPLRFASADTPPYITEEGNGYYDLLMAELSRRIGREIDIRRLPSERSIVEAVAGRMDGEFGRIAGLEEQYPSLIRVPEPLVLWKFCAFATSPNYPAIESFEDLAGKRVAYINGWKIYEANVPGSASTMLVSRVDQLFQVLLSGRVDLALYSDDRGRYWMKQHPGREIYPVSGTLAERPMYLYLHRDHAQLLEPIAAALRGMQGDGTMRQLREETLGISNE